MKIARDFRADARAALTGRYWRAFLASLIALLLGGVPGSSGSTGGAASSSSNATGAGSSEMVVQGSYQLSPETVAAIGAVSGFVLIIVVIMLIVGSAVELGYNRFNISLFESGENPPIAMLFSRFGIFGKALALRLLIMVKTFLWSLLLVVPGIIAYYRYAMAPYILAEEPDIGASEAIERSKELMNGNKWRLFCLEISFIGWYLLSIVTLGLGLFFLQPYVKAAETAFYRELSAPADRVELI